MFKFRREIDANRLHNEMPEIIGDYMKSNERNEIGITFDLPEN